MTYSKNLVRCDWASGSEIYEKYHDDEWGVPVGQPFKADKFSSEPTRESKSDFSSLNLSSDMSHSDKIAFDHRKLNSEQEQSTFKACLDDKKQFEFLVLEGAQAGLSWLTILKRRDGYRRIFKDFDVQKVARFSEEDIQKALQDEGIIRNKLKVRAAVKNAKVFLDIQKEFGSFCDYIWGFVDNKPIINNPKDQSEIPATSDVSDKLSKDLKKRGMSFVGSTIIYAHMQATGMVNDHAVNCFRHPDNIRFSG